MNQNLVNRNHDFIVRCRVKLLELRCMGLNPKPTDVVAHVLADPAPSYYVDFDVAMRMMKRALLSGKFAGSSRNNAQWCEDMFRDLLKLINQHPHTDLATHVSALVNGNAGSPRFYISERVAMEILRPFINFGIA